MSLTRDIRSVTRPVRRLARRGVCSALRPVAYSVNRHRFRRGAILFNFHQATDAFDPRRHDPGTWTSIRDLERQLRSIRERWPIVPLDDAVAHVAGGARASWVAGITFDDGDASIETHIVPLLDRLQLPATIFVSTAHLDDGPQAWPRAAVRLVADGEDGAGEVARRLRHTRDPAAYDRGRRSLEERDAQRGLLPHRTVRRAWLETLDPHQYTIGLHGHEHQRYAMMPDAWQQADLERNRAVLHDMPAYRPYFAIPFGRPWDRNTATLAAARHCGVTPVLAHGGVHVHDGAPINRIPLDGRTVESVLRREIAGL